MLLHKLRSAGKKGFTIIELTIVISVIGISAIVVYVIFNTSFLNYLGLQQRSIAFDTMNRNSQRIATVVRGLTDITNATDNDFQFYSYFAPDDTYVSFVHYSLNSKPSVVASVTPMTANPPTGTPINSQLQNYTVIEDFEPKPGKPLFEYLDSSGNVLAQPISDLHTIKGVRINLGQKIKQTSGTEIKTNSLSVSLRNRKTNL